MILLVCSGPLVVYFYSTWVDTWVDYLWFNYNILKTFYTRCRLKQLKSRGTHQIIKLPRPAQCDATA